MKTLLSLLACLALASCSDEPASSACATPSVQCAGFVCASDTTVSVRAACSGSVVRCPRLVCVDGQLHAGTHVGN